MIRRAAYRSAVTLGGLTLLALACGSDNRQTGQSGPVPTGSVSVVDNAFVPAATTIQVGQSVTWRWTGSNLHDVSFDDPDLDGSPTQTSGSFEKTFPTAGEFTYFCSIHSRAVMSGRVTVSTAGG